MKKLASSDANSNSLTNELQVLKSQLAGKKLKGGNLYNPGIHSRLTTKGFIICDKR